MLNTPIRYKQPLFRYGIWARIRGEITLPAICLQQYSACEAEFQSSKFDKSFSDFKCSSKSELISTICAIEYATVLINHDISGAVENKVWSSAHSKCSCIGSLNEQNVYKSF